MMFLVHKTLFSGFPHVVWTTVMGGTYMCILILGDCYVELFLTIDSFKIQIPFMKANSEHEIGRRPFDKCFIKCNIVFNPFNNLPEISSQPVNLQLREVHYCDHVNWSGFELTSFDSRTQALKLFH